MNKKEFIKNKLDLEYHSLSLESGIYLTLSTLGILSFISSFIFLKDNNSLTIGLILAFIVFSVALVLYQRRYKRMKSILNEIENLIDK